MNFWGGRGVVKVITFNYAYFIMKGTRLLSMLAAAGFFAVTAAANTNPETSKKINDIASRMQATGCYVDTVAFTVSMPQLSDDVVYEVALTQDTRQADKLAPCSYLIDWTLDGPQEPVKGFSAYFDGHHYRFAGERLQEYHMEWDSVPFMPRKLGGINADGVQRNVQFANLLPAMLADNLKAMVVDSAYSVRFVPDTIVGARKVAAIKMVMTTGGITAIEGEYLIDPATAMPLRVHLENSPGTVSEQTVDAVYGSAVIGQDCPTLSEEMLMDIYPDAFGRYRTSNFRIENLPGTRLPSFSLPTTGERYTYQKGDSFRAPTLIAILDATTGFSKEFVEAVRGAVDELPFESDVIWAFTDNIYNIDKIEEVAGAERVGEHLLLSARGLARDCGATSLPVLIISRPDGTVASVIVGFNNNLRSDVIQKMLLLD